MSDRRKRADDTENVKGHGRLNCVRATRRYTGADDHIVAMWEGKGVGKSSNFQRQEPGVFSCPFSDCEFLISGSKDNAIIMWKISDRERVRNDFTPTVISVD